MSNRKKTFLGRVLTGATLFSAVFMQQTASAQVSANEGSNDRVALKTETEDSHTVPATNASAVSAPAMKPIDRALDIAENGLQYIRRDINDYTARLIKRERIDGIVAGAEEMAIKVRNRKEDRGVPFSIYMRFLKPSSVDGREVIFVEGQNSDKLIAHEGSGLMQMTVHLDPDGFIAMRGNRYPIYEAGIENLVFRLIEKGERDRKLGDATVKFYDETKINGRECTLIQVMHPNQRPEYEFHACRVFIDKELNVPIRYAAYGWPKEKGGKPTLEEEYTYLDVALNVGLEDADFDPDNSRYNFK